MKPVSAKIMSEIDRKAQEDYGIPEIVLMENAGRSVSECVISDTVSLLNERIAIFCGKGNNGGDGFVAARYLANESPGRLAVYVLNENEIKEGVTSINFKIIRKMGIQIRPLNAFLSGAHNENFTLSIDAIFGTGFKGELPREYADLGAKINVANIKRYAVDVPSGLDATTGIVAKNCLRADKTITFGLPKTGFYIKDGPSVCGEIIVKSIGYPKALLSQYC